jgi:hypothetical protein
MRLARLAVVAGAAAIFLSSFVAGGIFQSRAQHEGFCVGGSQGVLQKSAAFRAAQLIFLNTWTPQPTYAVWVVDASAGNPQHLLGRVEQAVSCAALRAWYGEAPSPIAKAAAPSAARP